jgi:acetyltransferase-like isoleucine patch superfamily enzyme
MLSIIKKVIPASIKSCLWQMYLRTRFRKNNVFGKNVLLSKDLAIENNCCIGREAIIGGGVKIATGVKIGRGVFIEKAEIGEHTSIESHVIISGDGHGSISIGKHCYIGVYNVLDNSNNITLGDFVHIAGPSTGLWTHTSAPMCLKGIPLDEKSEEVRPTAPIVVENNVYIGGNCTIYPGITIGHHSIVAPNSAVTKNVLPFSLVGGVPAKFIKAISI